MSNENQETIADIVAEMRSNEFDDPSFNVYSLVAARTLARGWADRIEAAWRREREAGAEAAQVCGEIGEMVGREAAGNDSLMACNAAAIRETLFRCDAIAQLPEIRDYIIVKEMRNLINAALSAPPRNCDRQECATSKAAQYVWRKEDGGKTAYYEWLLATSTKGGAE